MTTNHKVLIGDSRDLSSISDESVDLIVTSPPYPMIGMWDELFLSLSPQSGVALEEERGDDAFELMHKELDKIWRESFRVCKEGSFVCINIGDAARTVGGRFQLYSNHSRIISACKSIGFDTLPNILWRKQTNAPNKFMGSGTLPAGAYVTLEHEYILIFRKGGKRHFKSDEDKQIRGMSSIFWEERNLWFSDLWDLKGIRQSLKDGDSRTRSAAYPFELAYRLINMYSVQGDLILDPFLGTGTTSLASIATSRNSIGVEIDEVLGASVFQDPESIIKTAQERRDRRLEDHREFLKEYSPRKGCPKHHNNNYNFPVITKYEEKLYQQKLEEITHSPSGIVGSYS